MRLPDHAAPVPGGTPPGVAVVVLHGLFGSGRNWSAVARRLAGTGHPVHALDLRNHGAAGWDPVMDYPAMAADVVETIRDLGLDRPLLVGHSMGGKAAMTVALTTPDAIRGLVVVDIAPVPYPIHHDHLIAAMLAADLTGKTRRADVAPLLADAAPEPDIRQFLLQNLVTRDGALAWRINLPVLRDSQDRLADFTADRPGAAYDGPMLAIAGGASDYVRPGHRPVFQRLFPAGRIETVPGASHWVHAEKPDAVTGLVRDVLDRAVAADQVAADQTGRPDGQARKAPLSGSR